ncbi:MAG TPA: type VI secretion system tip protein TssI/VgrG [Pseudomonadales bacterium]|nr:type VI secretion system tip protein TssI/VgrG [Pseudomonadales bacterium]
MAKQFIPNTEKRIAKIHTPLGSKKFNVLDVNGRESVSDTFLFTVSLSSADTSVTPGALIGKPVCIQLDTAITQQTPRYFHGIVKSFKVGGVLLQQQRHYQLSLVPWIWFGSLVSHNRIFQQKNVIDIAREVLAALPEAGPIDVSGLRGVYPKRELCIQFDETDLHFVERILSEEGIAWFFQHDKNKHTLVLSDGEQAYKSSPAGEVEFRAAAEQSTSGIVSGWERQITSHFMQVDASDYNEFAPAQSNLKSIKSSSSLGLSANLKKTLYAKNAFSDGLDAKHKLDSANAQQVARRLQESADSLEQIISGSGTVPHFFAGGKFQLRHAIAAESGSYAVLDISHSFRDGSDQHSYYLNSFQCISAARPIPVKRIHQRHMASAMTAKVVELRAGDDSFTQVKVKFPWESKQNSCWLRVAQLYAGSGWGSYFVPRVGQEVIINFLNGDLNRPIIVGALYNMDNHAPPYSRSQSGIRTQSRNYNELVFDDKSGAEKVHFQAGRDYTYLVKHDEVGEVRNNQQLSVARNRTITVKSGNETKNVQSGSATLTAKKTIRLESSTQIELVVGGSKVTIGPQSISISSAQISIQGDAKVSTQAGGLVEINGGIVKIN